MTINAEQAIWLAGLITRLITDIEHSPGMTIEVDENPELWVQIVPEADNETQKIKGFILNYPYRDRSVEPLEKMAEVDLTPPPDTRIEEWAPGGFARVWIRPDVPLVGLAHFSIDVLHRIVEADEKAELAVRIEYGY